MDEAERLCDRCSYRQGQGHSVRRPVRSYPTTSASRRSSSLRSQLADDEHLESLPGVTRRQVEGETVILYTSEVARTMGSLIQHAQDAGLDLGHVTVRTATLEDVFLKLTGRRIRE